MKIIESEQLVSDAELDTVESKYNFKFPAEYRAFLLKHNGGRPERRARFRFLEFSGPYTDSHINWFLAVYPGEYDSFQRTFELMKVKHVRIPDNVVPIADDPFGNLICISVSGVDTGTIYFWDHEKEESPPTRRNLFLLGHSFDEFVKSLEHESDDT